jgi:hypothetical protein
LELDAFVSYYERLLAEIKTASFIHILLRDIVFSSRMFKQGSFKYLVVCRNQNMKA